LLESQGLTPPINLGALDFQVIEDLSFYFNNVVLIILGILVVMFIAYYITSMHYEKKKSQKND
jgi:hypothetical protein